MGNNRFLDKPTARQRSLSPHERQIALYTVAGMSTESMARVLDMTAAGVQDVIKRPHVQKQILALSALQADDLRETAAAVNQTIVETTIDAVNTIRAVMKQSYRQWNAEGEIGYGKLAVTAAQDILNRAGATAPTRVDVSSSSSGRTIDVDTLKEMVDVLKEMRD